MTAKRDRFDRFFNQLFGKPASGEEGSAALPTTIAETVRALDPRALGTLAHSTLATAPFLLAIEESQIPGTSLRYVLVHDEIGPAGFLLLTIVQLDLTGMLHRAGAGAGRAKKRAAAKGPPPARKSDPVLARIIVGGHPLFAGNHFFVFRDPEPTPSLLATMVSAAYRIRAREGIDVSLLKEYPEEDLSRMAPLERYGYLRFEAQPATFLRIDPRWKTFASFAASLPAAARRALSDRRRAFHSGGLSLERTRPTPVAAELAELHAHFWHRAPNRMAMLPPSFFRAVEDHLRDRFRLWVVRKDQRIIAFICALHDRLPHKGRNRLLGLFLGLDYRLNDAYCLYGNLMDQLVEEAIGEGFDVLDLGHADPSVRADLGAGQEPLFSFLLNQNRSMNPLLRTYLEQIIDSPRPANRGVRR